MRKGFVFSLDALASFSLIFSAIFSLLIFYAYPKLYLFYLLQAKTISSEVLSSLANVYNNNGISLLAYAIKHPNYIPSTIGNHIPNQYGYKLMTYDGDKWNTLYDTSTNSNDEHRHKFSKLSASSSFVLPLVETQEDTSSNPYNYPPYCIGSSTVCSNPASQYYEGKAEVVLVKLVVFA